MAQLDMIASLREKGLDHVLQNIFGYCDFQNLRKAESVSRFWKKAIDNDRIWKRLYCYQVKHGWGQVAIRNILESNGPIPRPYREICYSISTTSESLYANWKNGNMRQEPTQSLQLDKSYRINALQFTINYIITREERSKQLLIFNRWTYKLVKALDVPVKEIGWVGQDPLYFHESNVDENLIVASFATTEGVRIPTICVWNTQTHALMHTIVANEWQAPNDIDSLKGIHSLNYIDLLITGHEHGSHDRCHHCKGLNGGNLLITVVPQRPKYDKIQANEFTARWLPNHGQVVHLYRETISTRDDGTLRLYYTFEDGNYIITYLSDRVKRITLLQVRRACTFELVHTIQELYDFLTFECSDGLLLTVGENWCRIWIIATGELLNQVLVDVPLTDMRLVSDKFVFACNIYDGTGVLWELPSPNETGTRCGLTISQLWVKQVISSCQPRGCLHCFRKGLYVDEFQIVTYDVGASFENKFSITSFSTM